VLEKSWFPGVGVDFSAGDRLVVHGRHNLSIQGDAINGVFTTIIWVWIIRVVGTITSRTIVTGMVIT